MAAGLDLLGHLTIRGDAAEPLQVEFLGDRVVLNLPDLRAVLSLRARFSRSVRRAWLKRLRAALARAGLVLEVRIAGRPVGRLSGVSRPGRLSAWLGLDSMELSLRPVLAMLLRGSRRSMDPGDPSFHQ